jgi:isocitrate dehydrogenase
MENLYGDILSDVTAQMTGSVGLCGSANIGDKCAMFEAIHGSAPRRAGQNLANPSGLLLGAVLMLAHINQAAIATKVHNAWLKTLEDGVHTYDIFRDGVSKEKVTTTEFAKAVIARLGQIPATLKPAHYNDFVVKMEPHYDYRNITKAKKELVGVDVFLHWTDGTAEELGNKLKDIAVEGLKLSAITNRGVKIWPGGLKETFCVDHWRCRFQAAAGSTTHQALIAQLEKFRSAGFDFIKTENLYTFDGENGFTS